MDTGFLLSFSNGTLDESSRTSHLSPQALKPYILGGQQDSGTSVLPLLAFTTETFLQVILMG